MVIMFSWTEWKYKDTFIAPANILTKKLSTYPGKCDNKKNYLSDSYKWAKTQKLLVKRGANDYY